MSRFKYTFSVPISTEEFVRVRLRVSIDGDTNGYADLSWQRHILKRSDFDVGVTYRINELTKFAEKFWRFDVGPARSTPYACNLDVDLQSGIGAHACATQALKLVAKSDEFDAVVSAAIKHGATFDYFVPGWYYKDTLVHDWAEVQTVNRGNLADYLRSAEVLRIHADYLNKCAAELTK